MELDWDVVDAFLQKQIKHKPAFTTGVSEINELLKSHSIDKVFVNLDQRRMQDQFNEWLSIASKKNIPKHIKSIYFGLFSMVDPDNEDNGITTIHFCGSPVTPQDDDDWACEVPKSFFPGERYLVLDDFIILDENTKALDVDPDVEVLVFNGLLNLLVLNSVTTVLKKILANHKEVYLGTGFDAGDTYVLGRLTEKGIL